jgi:nucleotide-binding universal stress UspA family protein
MSLHEIRERDLRSWLEPAHQAGIRTRLIVEDGNAVDRIIECAGSEAADLIVIGTHGLRGFERFILGSVAEKVLRRSTCPVMTVPPASTTDAKVPYSKLLCAVDFGESSLTALRFAFSLAQETNAELTLLHVIDWPADSDLLVEQLDAPEVREVVEKDARRQLDELVTDEARTWCKPTARIDFGKPYRQILEAAQNDKIDLIVIGIHGRHPIDVMLFGSTTNQVVRQAPCPVLTLRQ